MDYILFKSDGSFNKQSLTRYIQQGNHNVDKIFIGYPGALSTDNVIAFFVLPNQTKKNILLNSTEYRSNYEYEEGHYSPGWILTLTNNQTIYNGLLMVTIRVTIGSTILVNYPFVLVINETGIRPDDDSGVTVEELDSYLAYLQNSGYWRYLGSVGNTSQLNNVAKDSSFDGRVYKLATSGTLNNYSGTTSVSAEDLVLFSWNEGNWYWVNLGHKEYGYLRYINSHQVAQLNSLEKTKELDGAVYHVFGGDGNLFNQHGETHVKSGEYVLFVWENGINWNWRVLTPKQTSLYKHTITFNATSTYPVSRLEFISNLPSQISSSHNLVDNFNQRKIFNVYAQRYDGGMIYEIIGIKWDSGQQNYVNLYGFAAEYDGSFRTIMFTLSTQDTYTIAQL